MYKFGEEVPKNKNETNSEEEIDTLNDCITDWKWVFLSDGIDGNWNMQKYPHLKPDLRNKYKFN